MCGHANEAELSSPSGWEGPFRRVPRLWDLLKALSLVASGANSEPTPGPVFDEASSGPARGDAEYRRWRPGRRIAKNGPPVRIARKQKGLIRRMMNAEPRNSARPTAYRSLAREHSDLLGTYVCTHQGARNTSTSRHQQGVGPLFAPATTSRRAAMPRSCLKARDQAIGGWHRLPR